MSSDLRRVLAVVEHDRSLAQKLSALGPDELVRWAEAEGYQLTLEEAGRLGSAVQEPLEEDLEQVAGGWSGGSDQDPP